MGRKRIGAQLLSRDDGMTLVEIMVAAVIMFIILTGVLTLVTNTTMMSLQSKQKNVMTNALNAYIEWAQSLPFEDVALVTDDGALQEQTTIVGGYTVVITPTVTPVSGNSALKTLRVDITVTDGQGRVLDHSTSVAVRDRSQFLTQGKRDPETDPVVRFGSLAPPSGAVVWDSQWAGGPIYLDVQAEAAEGRVIEVVRVSFNSLLCEDASLPPRSALWEPRTETFSSTSDLFIWNTHQSEPIEVEEGVFVDTRLFGDGVGTLKAWVVDDAGIDNAAEIFLVLDNFPPAAPGGIAPGSPKGYTVSVQWAKAMDGNLDADSYTLEWVRQGMPHTAATGSPFGYWDTGGAHAEANAANHPDSTLTHEIATQPFSRYAARVRAVSPRGFTSDWVDTIFESRPLLSGTYQVEKKTTGGPSTRYWKVTSTLSVTPPAFPTSAGATYSFYRITGGTETLIQQGAATTCTDAVTVTGNPDSTNFPVRGYRVDVTYTPLGIGGGTSTQSSSNTVTTVYQANAGTYTFTEGTW
ncbi:MAG: prepilin-type N-terminal cleavage/methylation domain-containing protein [Aeromicrobium sp.]|nr:prepilin-type N-terminal cleavage/methylation domain-containing protein [Aeromicrobium sp.]